MVASALLLRGSAEGISSFRIFGDEAYPQQLSSSPFLAIKAKGGENIKSKANRPHQPFQISKNFTNVCFSIGIQGKFKLV
jgi:hypothetical protein